MSERMICDICGEKTFGWVSFDHWPEGLKVCQDCYEVYERLSAKIK
jgi:ribosome-binding protein aMBF1 (putative translation factor)